MPEWLVIEVRRSAGEGRREAPQGAVRKGTRVPATLHLYFKILDSNCYFIKFTLLSCVHLNFVAFYVCGVARVAAP
jgi:hypothetical protein